MPLSRLTDDPAPLLTRHERLVTEVIAFLTASG